MEQWRKWWCSGPPELKGFCMPTDSLTGIGWRAALMWVLIAEWNTPDELTELIDKELLKGGD